MNKIPVYFMPGMAASPSIFEHIHLPRDRFEMFFLEWLIPLNEESMRDYCKRLLDKINHDNPVLIGVSFGAIIVQELMQLKQIRRVIIISSVKSIKEFPRRMQLSRWSKLHKLLPTSLVEHSQLLLKYNMGISRKKLELYHQYLSVKNQAYLDWALDQIINWQRTDADPSVIHIHGDRDPVFPIKYIKNCIIVPGGTHIMIVNRFRWFNENLPHLILKGTLLESN